MLRSLGIEVASHVIRVGSIELDRDAAWEEIAALAGKDEVVLACVDDATETQMKAEVNVASKAGDTVNGIFEVVVHGAPPGLGTYANWDERLDGQLAWAVMSLQAVKAVEIGRGVAAAATFGSRVHDPIHYAAENPPGRPTRFTRPHNNAGGIEGGVSNGEDIVVRGYLKPISTLRQPLESVRFDTRESTSASYERSDICVVPAAGVAAEAMVALVIANMVHEKFGGDSLVELKRNFTGYIEQLRSY
jgi:chorismate synthase